MKNFKHVLGVVVLTLSLGACTSTPQKPTRSTAGTGQVGSSNLSGEAVLVANLILNQTVQNCLEKIKKEQAADISIDNISRVEGQPYSYVLDAVFIVGGDVTKGSADILLTGKSDGFMGMFYDCKVTEK